MSYSTYSVVNAMNEEINTFMVGIDGEMAKVDESTRQIQSITDQIYESIKKFQTNMIQSEEKQLAHENILRIEQELKERFGDHETIRKTVMGIVKDFDINLVRNESISDLSEQLWITSSRYWLSYALLAINAWVNDYREVADNALAECMRVDPSKSSLFFCLLNLRFERIATAKKWFQTYLSAVDPSGMEAESAVLIQAYLDDLFGKDEDLKYNVNRVVRQWVAQLNAQENVEQEMVHDYGRYIELLPPAGECDYPALKRYCSAYPDIEKSYLNVSKYGKLQVLLKLLDVDMEVQTDANYKKRVDAILESLISNYDKEENVLREQEEYFNLVIQNDGKIAAAEEAFQEYKEMNQDKYNIGKQMIRWAVYDNVNQTNVKVKKFAMQNTKSWFRTAIENWSRMLQAGLPLDFPIQIMDWRCISNGEDQQLQENNLANYYDNNKFRLMYYNTPNMAAVVVFILSIALAFVTPYSLVATALAAVFLVVRVILANRDYPKRKETALNILNKCMEELADFKDYYAENSENKTGLLEQLRNL